jgi:MinD-like ATPase involved in chromosome partitioning or flagellar assembly
VTVFALASAKGSPGVSITGAALAATWPAPVVLADVDPSGGDVMWRNRTATGSPLDPDRGLLSLGAAVRRGAAQADLAEHLQKTAMGVDVLVGLASPDQLTGLGAAWGQLPAVFKQHRADVLVDCGRIVPGSSSMPVLTQADVIVFVARPDISGVAHLRERLRALRGPLGLGAPGATPTGVVVMTSYRDTRSASDLQQLLDAEKLGVTVLGIVADDEKGARILSGERVGPLRKTLLGRSAMQLAQRLASARLTSDRAGGR